MGRTLVANRLLAGSACGKRHRGRPLNSVVRHQAMSDFAALAVWALVAGVIAGVVVHWNVARQRRAKVMRWCLAFGFVAIAVIAIVAASGISIVPTRAMLGLAFVGLPAFVAGLTVLALGRVASRSAPGV